LISLDIGTYGNSFVSKPNILRNRGMRKNFNSAPVKKPPMKRIAM